MNLAHQRFSVVSRAWMFRALTSSVAVIVGVHWYGAPAVFVAPTIADILTAMLLLTGRRAIALKAVWSLERVRPLLREGLPLACLSVIYWAYRLTGSTSVAVIGSTIALGLYIFAFGP